jgi:hypothetical protein
MINIDNTYMYKEYGFSFLDFSYKVGITHVDLTLSAQSICNHVCFAWVIMYLQLIVFD